MEISLPTKDLIIRIRPDREMRGSVTDARTYQALVYTMLPLGGPLEVSDAEPWNGLPVSASGRINIQWQDYQGILADFFEGIKGVEKLSMRIRLWFSPAMQSLLDRVAHSGARRIWWASEATELDDIPWELLFHKPNAPPILPNCVRGLPPQSPPPILPLKGPLRLVWNDSPYTPAWIRSLFQPGGLPYLVCTPFTGGLREGLRQAARDGAEVLHCCTDGLVSLAYEGTLYDHACQTQISATELEDIVRGTRVSVIGLTPQEQMLNPDVVAISGRTVPSVYRAFTWFSSIRSQIPSIIAPLGPCLTDEPLNFWKAFYSELSQSYHLDGAMRNARGAVPGSPFAIFMRHGPSTLFRAPGQRSFRAEPEQIALSLGSSAGALRKIQNLQSKFGALPDYLTSFAAEEGKRIGELRAELAEWSRPEEGEE